MPKEVIDLICTRSDFFIQLSIEHLLISGISIILAMIIGGIIGILISEYRQSSKLVLSIINFLYTIPSISMLGFFIPLSGIGNTTAIMTLTLYALLPMVRNTYTGMTQVNPQIIEAAKGMGSTRFQILIKIKFPLAFGVIMSGIRNMVVMTLALAGIASFIGAGGLGVAIYRGITTNNTAMTVAGSLLIAFMALVFDFVLGLLEKHFYKKRKKKSKIWMYCLLVFAIICSSLYLTNKKSETIHIASKPMTEQYILTQMLKILIEEHTDLNVEITQGVGGGTSNIHPAMLKKEFDIYPEYTGTAWNMVLKKNELYTENMFYQLQDEYDQYDMQWVGMYGFSNSYALAVREDIALKYDLKKISDLKGISQELTFGAEYDFYEREDGYTPLCQTYGIGFKNTVDLDIGLKYQAMNQKEIDVMPIFTTDGMYSVSSLIVLKDDLQFYPSYQCGNIVRKEILEAYPEIGVVINKVEEILDDKTMAKLNYKVEYENRDPYIVASEFLKEKGLSYE